MLALLANPLLPQPALLDAIKFAETGHLSQDKARTAVSPKGAVGPYQFMQKFLPDFGYGMPKDIPLADVQDPKKARALADRFITGYSDYHQFTTPLQKLVAYNAGPGFAAQWIANGEDISQLPAETQQYITKAAGFLANQNTSNTNQGTQDMASRDGYDDARRAFFTEEDITEAKRRGITAESMIAIRETQRMLDPNRRRPDAMPSDIRESRMPTPQQVAAAQQRPNMMTRGGVDINNPQGGNVTTQPGFAEFMQGRQGGTQITPSASVFDYSNIPPALQNNPQFGDYMDGMIQANPDTPPAALAQAEADRITEAERMMAINNPLGGGGNSASLISSAMASQPPATTNAPPPITTSAPTTSTRNRRDMSMMSLVPPPQQIGLNEALIRIGGAGVRGSAQGGLEAIGAMTDTYGAIQDANRATGLAAYQSQMEALSKGKTDKQAAADSQQIGQIDQTLFDMDRALGLLQEGGVTGPFDAFVADVFDRAAGSPDRASRLLLQKLRVDDAMLRVAQTKGAISNKEMELFLAPAPSLADQEDVWIEWIRSRQEALRQVRSRLSTGTSVADPASATQVDQFAGQNQGNISLSEDDQSLVNKYTQ